MEIFFAGLATGATATCIGFVIAILLANSQNCRILDDTAHCHNCNAETPLRQSIESGDLSCSVCGVKHQAK